MLSDRHWLRRTWESLPEQDRALFGSLRPSGNPAETPALADGGNGLNERFLRRLSASQQRYTDRAAHLPALSYPAELPISSRQAEIVDAIRQHQALIICGETGSGKSTQLPKMCLAAGLGVAGMIGHTQPRRIAARSVASRLAEELQTSVGRQVGFKVRFSDQTAPETLIKLMTDGMLLAETPHDRFLTNYECIIVDEAHERSLNIDFLMGYLRRLLDKRRDLKVIITSATIDATRFAEHFSMDGQPAPILEVSGRGYPVEIRYRPPHGPESLQSDAPNPVAAKPASDQQTRSVANRMMLSQLAKNRPRS